MNSNLIGAKCLAVLLLLMLSSCNKRPSSPSLGDKNQPPDSENKSIASLQNSTARQDDSIKDASRTANTLAEISEWRAQALIPLKEGESREIAISRRNALEKLAKTNRKEAVAAVMEVLFLPANQLSWQERPHQQQTNVATVSNEEAVKMALDAKYGPDLLWWSLTNIAFQVEDAPPALKGLVYQAADLPVWQKWWEANKDNLRFKPKPSRPAWVDERANAR